MLFPRTILPLHIFEDRYKEMISDVLEENAEFGIVLAGEKGICGTGCTATVEKVLERYPDGRLDVLTRGRRRFEIRGLDEEKNYLRGEVEFFDDDEFQVVPLDVKRRAMEGFQDLRDIEEDGFEPEFNDPQLSFQLAQIVTDTNFRQGLLSSRSELERMKQLAEFLPPFTSRQRQIRHVRTVAPKNGHGKWPPSA